MSIYYFLFTQNFLFKGLHLKSETPTSLILIILKRYFLNIWVSYIKWIPLYVFIHWNILEKLFITQIFIFHLFAPKFGKNFQWYRKLAYLLHFSAAYCLLSARLSAEYYCNNFSYLLHEEAQIFILRSSCMNFRF